MSKVCFVRANNPELETRAQNMLAVLAPLDPVIIVWNRMSKPLTQAGWHVYNQESGFGIRALLQIPGWWRYVWAQLAQERPTLVHVCNFETILIVALYCKLFRARYIYDIWDAASGMFTPFSPFLSRILNTIERHYIKRAALCLLPDAIRLQQLGYSGRAPKNLLIVPNSIPFTDFKKTTPDFLHRPLKLLYTGTLSRSIRGLEMLAESVKNTPGIHLTIGGYGADEAALTPLFTNSPAITFVGKVSRAKVAKLLAETDLVVTLLDPAFPNYQYATSTKVYEAFAHAKPVITTTGTASGTLVSETQWGFVIPYTQAALQKLLTQLVSSNPPHCCLDPQAVVSYNWTTVAAVLQSAYQGLLE